MLSRHGRVLAVSSGGGHWTELLVLTQSLDPSTVYYASVADCANNKASAPSRFTPLRDASRWNKFGSFVLAVQVLCLMIRVRPDIIISTGAAPGVFALMYGKFLRARTIWIDSFANADKVSLSGRLARPFADLWLTQWPHLAQPSGPEFRGSVI